MNPIEFTTPPVDGHVVAIDPAINGAVGVAVFCGYDLRAAWSVKNILDPKEHSTLERAHYAAALLRAHVEFPSYELAHEFCLVVEEPIVYPNSPVPPNDLMKVALTAGMFAGLPWARACSYYPSQWKGQVDKATHHRRLLHLHPEYGNKLRDADHNAMDAFGLGLYHLQQMRIANGTY